MGSDRLFHMVPAAAWRACVEAQTPYYPPTYQQDGFIHLTADPGLLLAVANQFYQDSQGDWVVLVLDAGKLRAEVKWEPAAPVGDKSSQDLLQQESLFPHLYGTIDFESVAGELPMQRGGDGSFLAIPGLL